MFTKPELRSLWTALGLPNPPTRSGRPTPGAAEATSSPEDVARFFAEVLVKDPRGELRAAAALACFNQWARGRGRPELALVAFGRYAMRAGVERRRSAGSVYVGYRLPA